MGSGDLPLRGCDSRPRRPLDTRPRYGPRRCPPGALEPHVAGYGDAISNEAIWIRRTLQQAGYGSEIYALEIDPRVRSEVQPWQSGKIPAAAGLLYHHAIGSAITEEDVAEPRR